MTTMLETPFEITYDPKHHQAVRKGGVVSEKGREGYLVYALPPVGCMDPATDKDTLLAMEKEALGQRALKGTTASAGNMATAKSNRKAWDKVVRRAAVAYLAQ